MTPHTENPQAPQMHTTVVRDMHSHEMQQALRRDLLSLDDVQRVIVGFDDTGSERWLIVSVVGGEPCAAYRRASFHKPDGYKLSFTHQEP